MNCGQKLKLRCSISLGPEDFHSSLSFHFWRRQRSQLRIGELSFQANGEKLLSGTESKAVCEDGGEICFRFCRNIVKMLQRVRGRSGAGELCLPSLHPPFPLWVYQMTAWCWLRWLGLGCSQAADAQEALFARLAKCTRKKKKRRTCLFKAALGRFLIL